MSQQKQNLNEDYYYVLKTKRSATDDHDNEDERDNDLSRHDSHSPAYCFRPAWRG